MTLKYVKRYCLLSMHNKGNKFKAALRFHSSLSRLAKIQICIGGIMEEDIDLSQT
jgi:hypothetical protein